MAVKFGSVQLGTEPVIIGIVNQFLGRDFLQSLPPLVKILEIRADSLLVDHSLVAIQKYCQEINHRFALLLTVRENSQLDFVRKQEIIQALLPYCHGVDLEIDLPTSRQLFPHIKKAQKTLLASYHNFQETPDRSTLVATIALAKKLGADLVKLAVLAKSVADVRLLYELLQQEQNLITIAMGEVGSVSRAEALHYGSLATYAPLSVNNAPGQLTVEKIVALLGK